MIKHVSRVLVRSVPGLCGQVTAVVRSRMNLAILEYRLSIAEDEIDVPFDVAICEELAGRLAVLLTLSASTAIGIQCVLVAQKTHVMKHSAIAGNAQRDGLRALRIRNCRRLVVVLERDVFRKEVIRVHI